MLPNANLCSGDRIKVIPGQNDTTDGVDYFKAGDQGTVQELYLDVDRHERCWILWDRTRRRTGVLKSRWTECFIIVPKGQMSSNGACGSDCVVADETHFKPKAFEYLPFAEVYPQSLRGAAGESHPMPNEAMMRGVTVTGAGSTDESLGLLEPADVKPQMIVPHKLANSVSFHLNLGDEAERDIEAKVRFAKETAMDMPEHGWSSRPSASTPDFLDKLLNASQHVRKINLENGEESAFLCAIDTARRIPGSDMSNRFHARQVGVCIRYGSRIMFLCTLVTLTFRTYQFLSRSIRQRKTECQIFGDLATDITSRTIFLSIEIGIWVVLLGGLCFVKRLSHRGNNTISINVTYSILIAVASFYTLALFVPPLSRTCDDLMRIAMCTQRLDDYKEVSEMGCTMLDPNTMMAATVFVMLLPHITSAPKITCCICAVHLLTFFGFTMWQVLEFGHTYYEWLDIILGTCLLVICSVSCVYVKVRKMERQWELFRLDHHSREAGKRLFQIMECMLPLHVVVPMVQNTGEVIADHREIATVFFLVIDEFERIAREKSPTELLEFLNNLFTDLDLICDDNHVAKIETVSEEFVAAVGVLPTEAEELGMYEEHYVQLDNLVRAAIEMLYLQERRNVRFKMGMHTGAVIAGVIGNKLPRFRLFGDTINTAARMMQKGIVGELQFGNETKAHLPNWVGVKERGPIEMKGKGFVDTFLLDWSERPSPDGCGSAQSQPMAFVPTLPQTSGAGRKSVSDVSRIAKQGGAAAKPIITKRMSLNTKFANVVQAVTVQAEVAVGQRPSWESGGTVDATVHPFTVASTLTTNGNGDIRNDVRKDIEYTWFLAYIKETLMHDVSKRVMVQAICIVGMTAVEFFTSKLLEEDFSQEFFAVPRYILFLASRVIAVGALLCWWLLAYVMPLNRFSICLMHTRCVLICVVVLMLFLSYEALTPPTAPISPEMSQSEIQAALLERTYGARLWPLMFFIAYGCVVVNLRLPLWHTFLVVVFSTMLVASMVRSAPIIGPKTVDFNLRFAVAQVASFVVVGMLGIELAKGEQKQSKAQFNLKYAIERANERVQSILDSLLPPLVVEDMRSKPEGLLPSHFYESATIAQSDLVGFTALASSRTPQEVVQFISEIFNMFDALTDKYDIYKVETVGDAYIAGQAERPLTATHKPLNVLLFAAEMVNATRAWAHAKGTNVSCRVGVHNGPCVGGIVGSKMQRYHLFGNLLSILEGLESSSVAHQVQISKACKVAVEEQIRQDGIQVTPFEFAVRTVEQLKTSKGEVVEWETAGGRPTYMAVPVSTFDLAPSLYLAPTASC